MLENRAHYPDGAACDCVGHPRYAASWRFGTCLSNPALAHEKLAELTDFVRRCQPGMLYIHDIDTGDVDLAHEGWKRRCPACRERWPDDATASATGAAAGRCAFVPIAAARSVLQGGLKAPFSLCLVTTQGRRFHLPIALTRPKIGPLLELIKERVPSLDVYVTVLLA